MPHPSAPEAAAALCLDSVLLSRCKTHIFVFTFNKRHRVTVLVCFSPNGGGLNYEGGGGSGQLHPPAALVMCPCPKPTLPLQLLLLQKHPQHFCHPLSSALTCRTAGEPQPCSTEQRIPAASQDHGAKLKHSSISQHSKLSSAPSETCRAPPSPAPGDASILQPPAVTAAKGCAHCCKALFLYRPIFPGLSSNLSNTRSSETLCSRVAETICNAIQVFCCDHETTKHHSPPQHVHTQKDTKSHTKC